MYAPGVHADLRGFTMLVGLKGPGVEILAYEDAERVRLD
jgi:hypothetical protein